MFISQIFVIAISALEMKYNYKEKICNYPRKIIQNDQIVDKFLITK